MTRYSESSSLKFITGTAKARSCSSEVATTVLLAGINRLNPRDEENVHERTENVGGQSCVKISNNTCMSNP